MALLNAGTSEDPFVGGFHHPFQVSVGQQLGRNVGAESGYLGAKWSFQSSSPVGRCIWDSFDLSDAALNRKRMLKPGSPLHTHWPVTVASFRTWRGWRDCVAWGPATS